MRHVTFFLQSDEYSDLNEFNSAIRFFVFKKVKSKDIIEGLFVALDEHAPSLRTVYDWIAALKHLHICFCSRKACSRPPILVPGKIKNQLANIISKSSSRMKTFDDALNVSEEAIYYLFTQQLYNLRHFWSLFCNILVSILVTFGLSQVTFGDQPFDHFYIPLLPKNIFFLSLLQ